MTRRISRILTDCLTDQPGRPYSSCVNSPYKELSIREHWRKSGECRSAVVYLQRHFTTFVEGADHYYYYKLVADIEGWQDQSGSEDLNLDFPAMFAEIAENLGLPEGADDDFIWGVVEKQDAVYVPEHWLRQAGCALD